MWRLHHPARRGGGQVVHHPGRAGRRRRHQDHRGLRRAEREAASDPAGVLGRARPAMRLLHARHGDRHRSTAARQSQPDRGAGAARHRRQPVPLHGVPEHRQVRALGRPQDQRRRAVRKARSSHPAAGNGWGALEGRADVPSEVRLRRAEQPRRGRAAAVGSRSQAPGWRPQPVAADEAAAGAAQAPGRHRADPGPVVHPK